MGKMNEFVGKEETEIEVVKHVGALVMRSMIANLLSRVTKEAGQAYQASKW